MSTTTLTTPPKFVNAAEWVHALGDVPLERIVMNPWPGTATENDLLYFVEHDRPVELVDGTLVEKAMGWLEGTITANIVAALHIFVTPRRLGVIVGGDAPNRMAGGNVRLPDVTFISADAFPDGKLPTKPIPTLPPTLAVEVISKGNTKAEMRRKMKEYFESGTRLVWMVHPNSRTIDVYESLSEQPTRTLGETDTLDGGSVVPDFSMPVADVFATQL